MNVPYLHSVRLIDELLKKGKGDSSSFMTYPGEFHYFTREHVLRDAWHRVDEFFDETPEARTVVGACEGRIGEGGVVASLPIRARRSAILPSCRHVY